jgi:pyruvate dehydrogenase E2 component (dihydrolipoamide acetyltransferase)
MALEFKLPDIGEGVVEGEIVRWLVQEGDVLREDQPMVEVMTDKATVEIPTPKAGRVERIMVPAGKLCAVGQVMVVIATEGGASHTAAPAAPAAPTYHAPAAAAPAAAPSPVVSVAAAAAPIAFDPNRKVLATPATRQMARSIGVDIRTVSGTGPGGRITKADVAAAAQRGRPAAPPSAFAETRPAAYQPAPTPAPAPVAAAPAPAAPPPVEIAVSRDDERIPFRGVTDLVEVRKRAQKRAAERGIKLSFLPFIVKAVVSGLKKFPIVNSTHDVARDEIVLRKSYHIGVAAATDAGLIVPVVRDADKLSLFQIAERLEQLAERTRTGKASREELTGSTFTISSLGKLGGVLATPIINFPEVAVLGVHKIKETPAVRDGQIVIRQVMNLSISLDHRIVDGYEGAKFLQHVVSLLEDPTLLFMELT